MNTDFLKDYDEILTVDDLCKILKLSRNTMYKLIADGEIKTIKLGNKHRIPKQYLIDFLNPEK